jgi:hypothetical protein
VVGVAATVRVDGFKARVAGVVTRSVAARVMFMVGVAARVWVSGVAARVWVTGFEARVGVAGVAARVRSMTLKQRFVGVAAWVMFRVRLTARVGVARVAARVGVTGFEARVGAARRVPVNRGGSKGQVNDFEAGRG